MSVAAGSGAAGSGGVDAAGAVSAVNDWRKVQSATNFVPLPLAGPTPVIYLTLPFNVPIAGTYAFDIFLAAGATSANAVLDGFTELDGVPRGGTLFNFGLANGLQTFAVTVFEPLLAGAHTLDLYSAQPSSPGTVTVTQALIWVRRIL